MTAIRIVGALELAPRIRSNHLINQAVDVRLVRRRKITLFRRDDRIELGCGRHAATRSKPFVRSLLAVDDPHFEDSFARSVFITASNDFAGIALTESTFSHFKNLALSLPVASSMSLIWISWASVIRSIGPTSLPSTSSSPTATLKIILSR